MFEVLEPGSGVEFGIDGLDDPRVLVAGGGGNDLQEDNSGDGARGWDRGSVGRQPADGDALAVVLEIELLEVDSGLLTLTELELVAAGESWGGEREGLSGGSLWAGIDEGVDGSTVVDEVNGESSVGERVAVVGDERGVVVGDLLRFGCGHAFLVAVPPSSLAVPPA